MSGTPGSHPHSDRPNRRPALLQASPGKPSAKALANVALALKGNNRADAEHCPHCGGVVRVRPRVEAELTRVVNQWLAEKGSQ